jgi:phosphoglycerate dehydrogenase-like enzyme
VEVLFARERFSAGVPWTELGPLLPGWTIRSCSAAELADRLGPADVLCPFGTPVDEGVIAAGRFGLLQQFGVGLDGIDLEAATEHGVWVARLPGELTGNADSVAELAVLLVLTLLRRFDDARQSLRERRWGQPMGRSVAECAVLIVGLGAVGRAVLARLRPFGSRIVAVRAHPERGGGDGVDWVGGVADLGAAVSQADVVVCCATLDAASQSLFGAEVLGSCKPGSIFVNVARGGLVDEVALLEALDSGVLAGAGLDVHATEPADPDRPPAAASEGDRDPTCGRSDRAHVPPQRRAVRGQPAPLGRGVQPRLGGQRASTPTSEILNRKRGPMSAHPATGEW